MRSWTFSAATPGVPRRGCVAEMGRRRNRCSSSGGGAARRALAPRQAGGAAEGGGRRGLRPRRDRLRSRRRGGVRRGAADPGGEAARPRDDLPGQPGRRAGRGGARHLRRALLHRSLAGEWRRSSAGDPLPGDFEDRELLEQCCGERRAAPSARMCRSGGTRRDWWPWRAERAAPAGGAEAAREFGRRRAPDSLYELQEILELDAVPRTIVCFDVSHTQGTRPSPRPWSS
jgi:hypothetical protein